MLRQTLKGSPVSRRLRQRALLAMGLLALAPTLSLGGCSLFHRAKPGSEIGAEVKDPPGSHDPYPKLGSVPDRPKATETADTRREIAKALLADRDAAQYTDQALRGGTEASAPPPPPPVPDQINAGGDGSNAATGAVDTSKTTSAADDKPGFFGRLFGHKAVQ